MGGYGSGRRPGHLSKQKTEEQQLLDIRRLRKQDHLRRGSMGLFQWACSDRSAGWVHYRVEENKITLSYQYGTAIKDWEQMEQTIALDWTPCNLGGHRTWFLCPRCDRRVAILYGDAKRLRCRTCCGLVYGSQREAVADRLRRKARKIRERLGADNNLFMAVMAKPKGMHQKTFESLKRMEKYYNDKSLWLTAQRLRL